MSGIEISGSFCNELLYNVYNNPEDNDESGNDDDSKYCTRKLSIKAYLFFILISELNI